MFPFADLVSDFPFADLVIVFPFADLVFVFPFADLVSHEQKLSESLDTALTSALSSMPSFTAKLMKSQQQAPGEGGCSSSWSVGTVLGEQQMPVDHLWGLG